MSGGMYLRAEGGMRFRGTPGKAAWHSVRMSAAPCGPFGRFASLAASLRSKASSAHATDAAQAAPVPSESPLTRRTDECRLEGWVPRKCILPKHRRERNLMIYLETRFSDAVP